MPSILTVKNLSGREADLGPPLDMRLRRSWLITTNSRYYSEANLLQDAVVGFGLPIPYVSRHPDSVQYLCKRLKAKQEKNSPLHWTAEADFDTVPASPNQQEEEKPPMDRRAKFVWSTSKYQKAIDKTAESTPRAILNSAGNYFNPPPIKDVSHWTVDVTKNVAAVPTSVLSYPDRINSGTFTIQGISVAKNVAKIMGIRISDLQIEGETEYYVFSYTLEFDSDDKWRGKYLQQGLLQKSGSDRIPCVDKHGAPVRTPVPLDANGAQLSNPDPSNAVFTDYPIYFELDFSQLPLS